jgi:hypothetical protein
MRARTDAPPRRALSQSFPGRCPPPRTRLRPSPRRPARPRATAGQQDASSSAGHLMGLTRSYRFGAKAAHGGSITFAPGSGRLLSTRTSPAHCRTSPRPLHKEVIRSRSSTARSGWPADESATADVHRRVTRRRYCGGMAGEDFPPAGTARPAAEKMKGTGAGADPRSGDRGKPGGGPCIRRPGNPSALMRPSSHRRRPRTPRSYRPRVTPTAISWA